MTQTRKAQPKLVRVTMKCILSGDGESWGVGAVVAVAPDEAERLVSIGAAELAD